MSNRILITGGTGFIGSAIHRKLKEFGYSNIICIGSRDFDLRQQDEVAYMFQSIKPDVVYHLAALVGGIHANNTMKGRFFYENIIMNTMMFEQARLSRIKKLICMGSGCIYPRDVQQPIKEEYLWDGYPEPTNAPYAFAKRMLIVQSQAYREQYDFNSIVIMPGNVMGPFDYFNPDHSHVVPALIKKFVDAVDKNLPEVVVWGTGGATRDFVYVDDLAKATIYLAEKYNKSKPVNVSSGIETSIKDLAELTAKLTGFNGKIIWDTEKPDGQPRRLFDVSYMKELIGIEANTSLEEGLQKTINWYHKNKSKVRLDSR